MYHMFLTKTYISPFQVWSLFTLNKVIRDSKYGLQIFIGKLTPYPDYRQPATSEGAPMMWMMPLHLLVY